VIDAVLSNGPLVGSQAQVVVMPRYPDLNKKTAVIYLHGGNGQPHQCLVQQAITKICSERGIALFSILSNGANNWGIPAAVTDTHTAVTAVRALGYRNVYLYGISMGSFLALRYLQVNPLAVEGTILHLPANDMEFLGNPALSALTATDMVAAWGGQAAFDAAIQSSDPKRYINFYKGLRMQIWSATNDDVFGTAPLFMNTVRTFAANVAKPIHYTGAVNHLDSNLRADEILPFLDGTLNS